VRETEWTVQSFKMRNPGAAVAAFGDERLAEACSPRRQEWLRHNGPRDGQLLRLTYNDFADYC
jgi:hypothetical protein